MGAPPRPLSSAEAMSLQFPPPSALRTTR
ncbi:MAG: CRISPR-associated protein Cas5 [Planctomycetota bacterium]|nr:MAG: CRISPR-associated protein Cas5 [Planctomycetota bacterium]